MQYVGTQYVIEARYGTKPWWLAAHFQTKSKESLLIVLQSWVPEFRSSRVCVCAPATVTINWDLASTCIQACWSSSSGNQNPKNASAMTPSTAFEGPQSGLSCWLLELEAVISVWGISCSRWAENGFANQPWIHLISNEFTINDWVTTEDFLDDKENLEGSISLCWEWDECTNYQSPSFCFTHQLL